MKPIFVANNDRKDMAQSESSSSSCSDRESLISSEIQEHLQSRDGLKETDASPANPKEAERDDVSKQPRVIKNIIKALKEGKSRENASPSRDCHGRSSGVASSTRGVIDEFMGFLH